MEKQIFTIESNEALTDLVYKMVLQGDTKEIINPGQFVNIQLDGLYLRRPISVCNLDGGRLTIVYKVLGRGTAQMTALKSGERLDLLTGLGNGYDLSKAGDSPLLIGGGVGVPPLYWLAKELLKQGKKPRAILGFNTKEEMFLKNDFEKLGVEVDITTVDGSMGTKGYVTAAMIFKDYSYTYTCGNEPMLKAVYSAAKTDGQYSFEERMGCGFGACMGCTCKTKYGSKRICKDGPVLERGEIIW